MVTGLSHGGISTRDMEASIHFYGELLGGRVIMEIEEPKGVPWIVTIQYPDQSCIELFYPRPKQFPLGTKLGRNHLAFRVEDIEALALRLVSAGIPILSGPQKARDQNLQLWCQDPNGYPVEFLQYAKDCPQLVSGPKVLLY